MKIRISADSTCDLTREIINNRNIAITPLYITKGNETFRDGLDITAQDIFDYVSAGNPICSTAAVNVDDYIKAFTEYRKSADAVIHIPISSEFSSCYQNALVAAKEVGGVYVVDSRNLSTGIGHLVLEACDMAEEGLAPEEICDKLNVIATKVETSFILNTLNYLAKGGRCSAITAFGANLLKLRIIIDVKDGKMGVNGKYRGAYEKCVVSYITDRLKGREDINYKRVFVTHAYCKPELVEEAKKAIRANAPFAEIIETNSGCTISSHCGPDCLGILFLRK